MPETGDSVPRWKVAHDALFDFVSAYLSPTAARRATASDLFDVYRNARDDASLADCEHSWRVEGDGEYEPFHNVCEDCGADRGDAPIAEDFGSSTHP